MIVLEQVPKEVQVELLVVAVVELVVHLFSRQTNWCFQYAEGLYRWIYSTKMALQVAEVVAPFLSVRFAGRFSGMLRPNRHSPPIDHRRIPSPSSVSEYPEEYS